MIYSPLAPILILYFYDLNKIHYSYFIFPIGLIIYSGTFLSYGIYEKFGSEISISLVGHSMASDIVIRASADKRIKSVVAISPYSTGITKDFPKDLLLISGQFEII